MYLSQIKYAIVGLLITASASAAERFFVPPLFADFAGTESIQLEAGSGRGSARSALKIDVLVRPDDVVARTVRLQRIGLRVPALDLGPPRLTGSVTLSAGNRGSLRSHFAANVGRRPVTFFDRLERVPLNTPEVGVALLFRLPGGYRWEPSTDGDLIVHIELQSVARLTLEAAPGRRGRIVVSADLHARSGRLGGTVPILVLEATVVRPAPRRPIAGRLLSAGSGAVAPRSMPVSGELLALREHSSRLETMVRNLVSENRYLARRLDRQAAQIVRLIEVAGAPPGAAGLGGPLPATVPPLAEDVFYGPGSLGARAVVGP